MDIQTLWRSERDSNFTYPLKVRFAVLNWEWGFTTNLENIGQNVQRSVSVE
jgi:hypothetical protein